MSKRGVLKISFGIFLILIVSARFTHFFVEKDFYVHSVAGCSPLEGTCFITDCDSNLDSECDLEAYKKIDIQGKDAPPCIFSLDCKDFSCDNIAGCTESYCSEETLEEGEKCLIEDVNAIDPETFSDNQDQEMTTSSNTSESQQLNEGRP